MEDIDDNPPVMAHSLYSTFIMENTEKGVEVLQVAASDPDTVRIIFIKIYKTFRIQKIFLSSESCKSNKQTNALALVCLLGLLRWREMILVLFLV